ncbi:MAG: CheR family methyltransferase [Pseudomonadota bacterium]|nr:CheR family methyltransferase [Pseudomonadota bacterium]
MMHDIDLTPDLHQRFCDALTRASGIRLGENKRTLVETRLRKRVQELGMADTTAYMGWVFQRDNLAAEMPVIINLLTTNKTDFFREPAHYDYLRTRVLPAHLGGETFTFWSAASATGEEAYSAAMLMAEHFHGAPAYTILGSDISQNVLSRARKGVYYANQLRDIPAHLADKYIVRGKNAKGHEVFRITADLREHVRFAPMNLMLDSYPVYRGFHAVFLRNVLIYFDEAVQRQVIGRIVNHIRPGGYLFVGHSETMQVRDPRLIQCASAIYRKEQG